MQQCEKEHRIYSVHQRAVEALATNPHLRQRKLSLRTRGDRVTVEGTVNSYFEKQVAQESLKHIPGVNWIENQLHVSCKLG
jgi:osmotically-inducible protein OsmY